MDGLLANPVRSERKQPQRVSVRVIIQPPTLFIRRPFLETA